MPRRIDFREGQRQPDHVIGALQVMRAIAAIAVVLYHTNIILAQPEYGGQDILKPLAAKGWLGVNFFFVLSGFIIMHAHERDLGQPARIRPYLWRRFIRVYPIYWLVLAVYVIAAGLGIGHPDFSWNPANLASAVLLIKLTEPMSLPLQVAWTLVYEVQFYAIFALLLLHRGLGWAVILAWAAAILIHSAIAGSSEMGPLHMWNMHFIIGLASYRAYRHLDGRWGVPLASVGLTMLLVMTPWLVTDRIGGTASNPAALLGMALPFGLIVTGAAMVERQWRWSLPRIAMLLGAASYSIYLVHSPAISVIAILQRKFAFGLLPPQLLFWGSVAISIMAGVVVHWMIERPLLAALRQREPGRERHE
jgi:exopolysaccharide production protein ExoZ